MRWTSAAGPGCRRRRSSRWPATSSARTRPCPCSALHDRYGSATWPARGGTAVPRAPSTSSSRAGRSTGWTGRASCRAPRTSGGGGFLVALDFGDTGRSPRSPASSAGTTTSSSGATRARPRAIRVTAEEAARVGLEAPAWRDFAASWSFTARQYAEFLMTESNLIAAIEYGSAAAERSGPARVGAHTALRRRPAPGRLRGLHPDAAQALRPRAQRKGFQSIFGSQASFDFMSCSQVTSFPV